MRMPCEHGRYDYHATSQSPWECDGGREPTRQELLAFAKSKGWIDYKAAIQAVTEYAYFGRDPEEGRRAAMKAAVDAALSGGNE